MLVRIVILSEHSEPKDLRTARISSCASLTRNNNNAVYIRNPTDKANF